MEKFIRLNNLVQNIKLITLRKSYLWILLCHYYCTFYCKNI